jgi:esterase/lipase superfamily enzyme
MFTGSGLRLLLSLSILLSAASAVPSSIAQPDNVSVAAMSTTQNNPFPVFFVTNREREIGKKGAIEFNSHRTQDLQYGMIPAGADAQPGTKVEHANIKMFKDKEEFLAAIKGTGSERLAVFVHGYRKSFDGAISLGRKLETNLQIPVVVFAWPSKNKYSAYMGDEATAEWSAFPLAQTLAELGQTFNNPNISVVSHSLGSRMVAWSLRILASEYKRSPRDDKFKSIVFCSPDFDRDTFMAESPMIKSSCSNVKIYLDSHDTRIWLSKVLHGNARLGSMDKTKESQAFMQVFDCDMSLQNHHIPFPLLTADGFPSAQKKSQH